MSVSGSTKTCPRCKTLLPARMTFCDSCGLQFAASDYDATSLERQGSPERWPSRGQPGYMAADNLDSGPYPGEVAAPPKKGGAGKIIVLSLVLVVLVGGGAAAWFLYLSPSHSSSPLFDRQGLQSNVPLPNGTSFAGLKKTYSALDALTNTTVSADAWGWTVSGSDAAAVQKFYQDNLPKNGWTKVKLANSDQGRKGVTACQGSQVLLITASSTKLEAIDANGHVTDTITAPSGGSALIIELSGSKQLAQFICADLPIP